VALSLEKAYQPHPKLQHVAGTEDDVQRKKMWGYVFTRFLLIFACVLAPALANLVIFNTTEFKWCIVASLAFAAFLLLSIPPAAAIYNRWRIKNSEVPQDHTPDSFQVGDRIRKYRQFAAATVFFGCCPFVINSGFVTAVGEEIDEEIYVVQRIDLDLRRVLLSKDHFDVEGNLLGACWWDSGSSAYYRVYPNTHGPAFHFDCYQRVRKLGKGQGAGSRRPGSRPGTPGAVSINDLEAPNFSPISSSKEIKMMSASLDKKSRSPLSSAVISMH